MIYEQLAGFVQNRMRMSHLYQPVMLLTLLRAAGGKSSTKEVARSILAIETCAAKEGYPD